MSKHRVQSPLERWPSMISMNRPKMESAPARRKSERSLVSFGRYIPKYFILFVAMVNEIVSLISLSIFLSV